MCDGSLWYTCAGIANDTTLINSIPHTKQTVYVQREGGGAASIEDMPHSIHCVLNNLIMVKTKIEFHMILTLLQK